MKERNEPDIWRFFFLPLLVMFTMFMLSKNYLNNETSTIKIEGKYTDKEFGNTRYYVVGSNRQVYEIDDLPFKFNINEKELYENIEVGKVYEINTTGYAIDFFSHKIINSYISVEEKEKLEKENELEIIRSEDGDFVMTPEMKEELSNNKGED